LTKKSQPLFNRENALTWAFFISIGLHLIAAIRIPNISFQEPVKPIELVIDLAPHKPEPPAPVKPPEPVKPKGVPPPQIKPIPQPIVKPVNTPTPISEPPPVIAAAPKAEVTPSFVAPAPVVAKPEPPKPTVNQADLDSARNQYGSALSREIAKHINYPGIAKMRGWQGVVEIDFQLDGNGKILSQKIRTSSGFEVLDKQALEMVKKSNFPTPPEVLKSSAFNVTVPVSFRLE
jgi:protein TonB